ncbi:MAG: adenylosuccinate synthase [SAR324 cluster bacterium]|nr:adenylosuccinate synthase [SAR324 cluster bacterium]
MTCVVIVGTQWGDEGKGKLVDFLTEGADLVARYQGGNNAGHTVKFEDQSFILHLIPSGILRNKMSVIGNGTVVDPEALLQEFEGLQTVDISVEKYLKISETAHLIMPYHRVFDKLREQAQGDNKIGTTGRGIGPAYTDKVARSGIRFTDLKNPAHLRNRLETLIPEKNCLMKYFFQSPVQFSVDQIVEEYRGYYEQFKSFLCDSSLLINQAIDNNQNVLFEGAQGTFLDVDHGTYPFVTSSNTMAGGVCAGCGVGPSKIDKVIGIVKAYTTRVGSGPFPTELLDDMGGFLRKEGSEFGATTGRPRRCGWFDAVLVRQAVRLNGLTSLAITKLDVLDKLETIKMAVGYQSADGKTHTELPPIYEEGMTPIYEEHSGWQCPTKDITEYDDLPKALIDYLNRMSELVGAPVSIISVGPKREETIVSDPDQIWA